jgi:hypothetical protein
MKLQLRVYDHGTVIHDASAKIRMVTDATSEVLRMLDKAPAGVEDWTSMRIDIKRDEA